MRRVISLLLPSLICVVAFTPLPTGRGALASVPPSACGTVTSPVPRSSRAAVGVELVAGDQVASVALDDSAATRSLLDVLPMTLELRNSFGLAMVGTLPAGLDAGGAAGSCNFEAGDVVYSPQDGAIAIFHSADSAQLTTPAGVRLGRVTSGLPAITAPGNLQISVRRVG